ncbi:MAG: His/Gly/Thr/Pro-type tRNA ligase C-terminal domain-containing protein [Butyricimonas faecalis]
MPLVKKDGLPEKAEEIMKLLRLDFANTTRKTPSANVSSSGCNRNPVCITIDHQTLEDNAVTIRYRDTMEQERVAIDQLHDILRKKTDLREILKEVKI